MGPGCSATLLSPSECDGVGIGWERGKGASAAMLSVCLSELKEKLSVLLVSAAPKRDDASPAAHCGRIDLGVGGFVGGDIGFADGQKRMSLDAWSAVGEEEIETAGCVEEAKGLEPLMLSSASAFSANPWRSWSSASSDKGCSVGEKNALLLLLLFAAATSSNSPWRAIGARDVLTKRGAGATGLAVTIAASESFIASKM